MHFDPIEKKPLYHYYPGSIIFSVGSVGCNLHCKFCQNSEISQSCVKDYPYLKDISPNEIIKIATSKSENIGIAYTYNEPAIWFEYMLDIATSARHNNLKNIMVTNGFINPEPLNELLSLIDAFSVDLKSFTEEFYKKITFAKLKPVKETLKVVAKSGNHLEITNLIIPTLNDSVAEFEEMTRWIAGELGKETVLHISKYFPTYKMTIESTPEYTLSKLLNIAKEHLDYVFVGNARTSEGRDTLCSKCANTVISRNGYWTSRSGLDSTGRCSYCGNRVAVMD